MDHSVTDESAKIAGPFVSAEATIPSTSSEISAESTRPVSKTTAITWQAARQATDDVTFLAEMCHTCSHGFLRLAAQAFFW